MGALRVADIPEDDKRLYLCARWTCAHHMLDAWPVPSRVFMFLEFKQVDSCAMLL